MKIVKNLALGALGAGIALFGISLASSHSAVATAPTDQEAFVNAAESTINGVVSVKNYATPQSTRSYGGSNPFSDPFFDFFFGNPGNSRSQRQQQQEKPQEQLRGGGSGVILSKDGYIVTNNHVIDGADRIEVVLNDNRSFNATVVGTDPDTDLALIKIETTEDLNVIPMGDSDDLRVGEWVLAVGNPFGFTSTVTSGIVSAKARNISAMSHRGGNGIESYIQTDAALNPGNSGGALVNLDGQLVGINSAIYSSSGQYAGCSFAIPTSIVKKVVADLKEYGTVQRAMLGISFSELTPELVKEKEIKGVNAGIYVATVADRSAAMEAGLQEGDVIVSINGNPTTNTAQVQEAMAKCSPGDKVKIVYYRNGKKDEKTVTLRNGRGNTEITRAGNVTDLGCAFATVSKETKQQLGLSHGVQVKGLDNGAMKDAGIRDGFIILEVNNTRVSKPEDIEKIYNAVMKNEAADKVLIIKGIYSTGRQAYYAVNLDSE